MPPLINDTKFPGPHEYAVVQEMEQSAQMLTEVV